MRTTSNIMRGSLATRLRAIADRLEPPGLALPSRPQAPLIRLGGRWWQRKEIAGASAAESVVEPDD